MKKIFTLIAGMMLAASASATPYKNLYVEAQVVPAGAGVVYLSAKNDAESAYVVDKSEDYDETAFLKVVVGENGGGDQFTQGDCQEGNGMYEVKIFAEVESDYEVVCLANVPSADDNTFAATNVYAVHTGTASNEFVFSFDYSNLANGALINVNNPEHGQDGHSEDGPSQEECMSLPFNETPDTHVYVVCRKIGDEYPKLDVQTGVARVIMSADENAPVYNVAGQVVNSSANGILIQNGRKFINK